MRELSNREKAMIVSALKENYPLPLLLHEFDLPGSSYFYQISAIRQPDKYAGLRTQMREIFHENRDCYGYRRIWYKLQDRGIIISEKTICRIMKEEGLAVSSVKHKKYNSYWGEISPELENIIGRKIHSETPNTKWLTGITEFALPAGNVYLSPIGDWFDGFIVSWTVGTSPNAVLVNTMLDKAIAHLKKGDTSIIHTDVAAATTDGLAGQNEWIEPDYSGLCQRRAVPQTMRSVRAFLAD